MHAETKSARSNQPGAVLEKYVILSLGLAKLTLREDSQSVVRLVFSKRSVSQSVNFKST